MANAMMFSDEVSVLAFNPAAITQFDEKGQLAFGASHITPKGNAHFYSSDGSYMGTQGNRNNPAYVPYGYYARKVAENGWFGIGVYPRFGLYATYSHNWMGRYNNYNAELATMSFVPTYAWKLGPTLSMAFSAEIMYADLKIGRALNGGALFPGLSGDVDMGLNGDSIGFGWNTGLNWQATEKWSLAFVYRSEVSQDMGADVAFSALGGAVHGNSKARGKVTLPESYTIGIGYRFDDRTRAEFNAIRTNWSSYDSLNIALWGISVPALGVSGGTAVLNSPKNWDDGWRYQFGIEHKLNQRWTIRAGYCYDAAVAPDSTVDFMVPTGDREAYSIGASYRVNNVEYSLGYAYMTIGERTILNADGSGGTARVSDGYANIFAVGCRIDL